MDVVVGEVKEGGFVGVRVWSVEELVKVYEVGIRGVGDWVRKVVWGRSWVDGILKVW